ncbi:ERCC4 domain-containing protein [Clostridium sp.]|uniref:ERCC4 domain-containing protein n=1 Tax=Clostridium sp. TaxID=1506 RepID=UPI003F3A3F3D
MKIERLKYKMVVDSREKSVKHILNKWDEGLEYKPSHLDMFKGKKSTYSDPIQYYVQDKGLKIGDYTIAVQLPKKEVLNFQDKVVVERKFALSELCQNLFDSKRKDEEGKNRFERELSKAYEQGIKVHLVVEVADMIDKILSSKHFRYDKSSNVNPKSFNAMLMALTTRYNVSVWYCGKNESHRLIHDILYYHAREYLKDVE